MPEVKAAVTGKDADKATPAADALKKLLQEAGAAFYAQAQSAGPQPSAGPSPQGRQEQPPGDTTKGRVVDAAYREHRA